MLAARVLFQSISLLVAFIFVVQSQGPQKSCCNDVNGNDWFLQSPADTVQECHINIEGLHSDVEYHGWAWDINLCHLRNTALCDFTSGPGSALFCFDDDDFDLGLFTIDGGGTNNIVGFPSDVVSDGCGPLSNAASILRTWTSTSNCGGTPLRLDQTILLSDTEQPVLRIAPDFTLECGATPPDPLDFLGFSAFDMCTEPSVTVVPSVVTDAPPCSASFTVTYTATDFCTADVVLTHLVTIEDTSPPVISNDNYDYSDRVYSCASDSLSYDLEPFAADFCYLGGAFTTTVTSEVIIPGSCDNQFTLEKTYTVSDQCGNSIDHVTYTYVDDTIPPTISVTPLPAGVFFCAIPPGTFTATDNCGGDVDLDIELIDGESSSSYVGIASTKVTATDSCGNSVVQFFTAADLEFPASFVSTTTSVLASKGTPFDISYFINSFCSSSVLTIDAGPALLVSSTTGTTGDCTQGAEGGLIFCTFVESGSFFTLSIVVPVTYVPHTLLVSGSSSEGPSFAVRTRVDFDN